MCPFCLKSDSDLRGRALGISYAWPGDPVGRLDAKRKMVSPQAVVPSSFKNVSAFRCSAKACLCYHVVNICHRFLQLLCLSKQPRSHLEQRSFAKFGPLTWANLAMSERDLADATEDSQGLRCFSATFQYLSPFFTFVVHTATSRHRKLHEITILVCLLMHISRSRRMIYCTRDWHLQI